jgi:hypothetical protein
VDVTQIEEGLWRWTTAHPEWKPGSDWDRDVGCVYWETPEAVVLVDPLVPVDDQSRTRFLEALDRDVERLIPQLREELAPLLDLPVERVLTAHGPPVLTGGRDALARALGADQALA